MFWAGPAEVVCSGPALSHDPCSVHRNLGQDACMNKGCGILSIYKTLRQAICSRTRLLQGRRWGDVKDSLEEIWTMAFRAIDDIKVRYHSCVMVPGEILVRTML